MSVRTDWDPSVRPGSPGVEQGLSGWNTDRYPGPRIGNRYPTYAKSRDGGDPERTTVSLRFDAPLIELDSNGDGGGLGIRVPGTL
jgi:hypothetical protein